MLIMLMLGLASSSLNVKFTDAMWTLALVYQVTVVLLGFYRRHKQK